MKYQKLTPEELSESDIKTYSEALDFVCTQKDLTNIALSGAYGSGKSSVIRSYENIRKKGRYIYISLANFEEKSMENLEKQLEGKILNQFVHQVDYSKMPLKRFKVTGFERKSLALGNTLKLSVAIILFLYLFFYSQWSNIVSALSNSNLKSSLSFTLNPYWILGATAILFVIILNFVYKSIRAQSYKNFLQRLKIATTEIELSNQAEGSSYFDKYLDEILYVLLHAHVDIVVFEDIDRYEGTLIFSKLREMNILANTKLRSSKKPPIRFLYLLRDDLFESKDRTKFFDFIIPIVPVVDSTNSIDRIIKVFGEDHEIVKYDVQFLYKLSLYIDDMRVLKNIHNEYSIYRNRLGDVPELKNELLLSLIVYKNIFPNDFANTQLGLGRGVVHRVFESKNQILEHCNSKLNEEIDSYKNQLKEIEARYISNIDELDALHIVIPVNLLLNNQDVSNYGRLSVVKSLKSPDSRFTIKGYNNYMVPYDCKLPFLELEKNNEYVIQKKILGNGKNERIGFIENKIRELEQEKSKLLGQKLHRVIQGQNVDDILCLHLKGLDEKDIAKIEYHKLSISPYFSLLKFLIRTGYIDETYRDHMTYFIEGSLMTSDKVFLRSLTDSNELPMSYRLVKVPMVAARLDNADYTKNEILNFDLLAYLLEYDEDNAKKIIQEIVQNKRIDFVHGFVQAKTVSSMVEISSLRFEIFQTEDLNYKELLRSFSAVSGKFFDLLNKECPVMWKWYSDYKPASDYDKLLYLYSTFNFSSKETLLDMNNDGEMTSYLDCKVDILQISTSPNVLLDEVLSHDVGKIKSAFEILELKTKGLSKVNHKLFKLVYENNFYEINYNNIDHMLVDIHSINGNEVGQYTKILMLKDSPVYKYVHQEINQYVESLIASDLTISDSEAATVDLLNSLDLKTSLKGEYILRFAAKVSDLEVVKDDSLWEALINNNKVVYCSENVLSYYFRNSLDSTLVDFLNNGNCNIDFSRKQLGQEVGDDKAKLFFFDIMSSVDLTLEKYKMILAGYEYKIPSFDFVDIEDEKIQVLIENGSITMNKENLNFLRVNYLIEIVIVFVISNLDAYIELAVGELFINDEGKELLRREEVSVSEKLVLAQRITTPILIDAKLVENELILYILQNKFDKDNIALICSSDFYNRASTEVKNEIEGLVISNSDLIGSNPIAPDLLHSLIYSDDLSMEESKRLVICYINTVSVEKSLDWFRILKMNQFISLLKGGNPKFDNSPDNLTLLGKLEELGWISSFDDTDQSTIRAYGKRKKT